MLESRIAKELFAVTDLVKSDAMLTLKLDRESLYNGLNRGGRPEEVLPFLNSVSQHGLPQNVQYSVQEWLDAYGAVSFESHFLLRVKKGEVYEKIRSILSGTQFRFEALPPVGFSISYADYQPLFSILSRLGFSPRPYVSVQPLQRDKNAWAAPDGAVKPNPDGARSEEADLLLPDEKPEETAHKPRDNGKYGGKFKKLPYNELVHVLNYSILMEQKIEAELKNERGRILLLPAELNLQVSEPIVKGQDAQTGEKAEVRIDDIERIRIEG